MELLVRSVGPLATNVYVLGDRTTHEAIAIDTATPSVTWIAEELVARGWNLKLIVSTHGHWDHIGDNARLQAWTREQVSHLQSDHAAGAAATAPTPPSTSVGPTAVDEASEAQVAVHLLDRDRLLNPQRGMAPFEIPPSVPAVELAEGGTIRFGSIMLSVLHTPGHTEGSVCLLAADDGILFSGDTLFAAGWGRVDLPGGSADQMADSIARLNGLDDPIRVLPGHGPATTIGRERPWMELVARAGRLFA